VDELQQERLSSIILLPPASSIGRTAGELELPALEVRLVSLRRKNGKSMALADDLVLMEGDTLVLSGKADMLEQAEQMLLKNRF
jgi:CPA2 family monovalent cation:H+ antiporter-2